MARAPHRLKRRFHHHRYAAMPMECRGVVSLHEPRTDAITIWSSTQVVHWVRREAAARAAAPGSPRALCRARRRRRLWRQRPRLSRRPADPLSGAPARPAGEMDRGPPRASDVLVPLARPDSRCRGWLRRRGPHPGLARSLHGRLRRMESDRRRRGLQHRRSCARPVQDRRDGIRGQHRRHQQGAERALSRRRPAGSGFRHGTHHGSGRCRARP